MFLIRNQPDKFNNELTFPFDGNEDLKVEWKRILKITRIRNKNIKLVKIHKIDLFNFISRY